MCDHPLHLSAAQAMAFHQAVEDRDAYIREQPWKVRMRADFEDSVPLPGCPHCWGDAAGIQWDVFAHELWTSVQPCGHWFRTDLPIIVRRAAGDWTFEEQWMP